MDSKNFELYLAKAISKSKTKKKPLLVLIQEKKTSEHDNKTKWIDSWIAKENIELIEKDEAAVLFFIWNGNNANFHFFKNYAKNLSNYDSSEHDEFFEENKTSLFIINKNTIQEVICDTYDKEECNSILSMFISSYKEKKEIKPAPLKIVIQKEKKTEHELSVQKASEIHNESERKYKESLLKEQHKERLERERIRKLIEQDKLDKKGRFIFNSNLDEVEVLEKIELKDHIHNYQGFKKSSECKLSIKTFDNKNIIHSFNSQDSLDTVRKYLVEVEKLDDNFLFHRNVPRLTYKDIEEFKSLRELDLLPRSVLILEPKNKHHEDKKDYFEARNLKKTGITDMIYSWWNGAQTGETTTSEENENEKENEKKDIRETYNGNSTNVIDPKDLKKD
ncbi:hypothetical protein QEN19_003234 [Hanseniaspora menglaensis]